MSDYMLWLDWSLLPCTVQPSDAAQRKYEYMPELEGKDYGKPRAVYPDFTMTESGLQYKDVRVSLLSFKGGRASRGFRL